MRLHNQLRIFGTAATVAAFIAPAAQAEAISNGGGGGPLTTQHVAVTGHQPASTDWTLIALATGGGIAVVGAGLGGSRLSRRHASAPEAQTPDVA